MNLRRFRNQPSAWERVARWSARHPWAAIAGWLAFVLAALALGAATGTKTLDNGAVGETARGYQVMRAASLGTPDAELAYVHPASGNAPAAAIGAAAGEVARGFASLGLSAHVSRARGGQAALVTGELRQSASLARVRAAVRAAQAAHPGVTIEETGDLSIGAQRDSVLKRDLHRAELLSIPVTLLVLLLAFGSLVAAVVPVVLALSGVLAGHGLAGPLSHLVPVQSSANKVALLIGMAVGVDYALFYIVRTRAERRRGASPEAALQTAIATSGHTVLVSGCAVAIAMSGLYIAGVNTLSGIATATIAVVACAVAGSLTVLPATLRLLGARIDRGRLRLLPGTRIERPSRIWPFVAERVSRRPLLAAAVATAALLALAAPALSLHVSNPSDRTFSEHYVAPLRTLARVRQAFPGTSEPAIVTVQGPPAARAAVLRAAESLRRRAIAEGVAHAPARVDANPAQGAMALFLPLTGNGANRASRDALARLRGQLVPATLGRVPGVSVAVTGATAEDVDYTGQIRGALPYVIAFVLTLAFGVLLTGFRSLVVPVKAVVLNLLSVGASYGLIALVFEHTWAEPLLGFHSTGAIVAWLPLFLFVVLFGLSMDYHVFILSRVREAVDRGTPTDVAVRDSIAATAGVVNAAAFVMVGVFALFATISSLDLKEAGVGLAAAVLIDATVIRGVLLPASMQLLGERNWYLPRWLRRRWIAQPNAA
jgi:uncharacterized membrane protein YdfJ with MMPL/SSD domain